MDWEPIPGRGAAPSWIWESPPGNRDLLLGTGGRQRLWAHDTNSARRQPSPIRPACQGPIPVPGPGGPCVTPVLHQPTLPTMWLLASVSPWRTCTWAVGIRRTRRPHGNRIRLPMDGCHPPPRSVPSTHICPIATTHPSCLGQCPNIKLLLENWESTPGR